MHQSSIREGRGETFWLLLHALDRPRAVYIKARGVPTYARHKTLALHPRLVLGLATVTQVAQALIHPYPIFLVQWSLIVTPRFTSYPTNLFNEIYSATPSSFDDMTERDQRFLLCVYDIHFDDVKRHLLPSCHDAAIYGPQSSSHRILSP